MPPKPATKNDGEETFGAHPAPLRAAEPAPSWTRLTITRIEDLHDAVHGAGLDAMQMSRGAVDGNLAHAAWDGIALSAGRLNGTIALRGPLSQDLVTLGVGLELRPGSRQWLNEVSTRGLGIYRPGDDHDALYMPGSRYVTLSLTPERLETLAARHGVPRSAQSRPRASDRRDPRGLRSTWRSGDPRR